jgi:peptidoglycan hydrolase-like protein with peptidoglycan-binding domain
MTGRAAAVLVSAALLLPACGGGDGEGQATSLPVEEPLLGVSVEEPVAESPVAEDPLPRVQVGQGETLTQGDSGEQVTALQNALVALGFDPGPVDGQFGPGTRRAVVEFQARHSLPDDGIVGSETARIINQELGGAG